MTTSLSFLTSVSVTEQGQDISLTVVRGGGTFGRVTVYYHSGPVTESTVAGQDYNLEDAVSPGDLNYE